METHRLVPHPETPCPAIREIRVEVARRERLALTYIVIGDVAAVRWPEPAAPVRTGGLWQHSCFEAFITDGSGYFEFNLSPSGGWAAYTFDAYRAGMREAEAEVESVFDEGRLSAKIATTLSAPGLLALSAVIELLDGTKSYWALAHPPGRPDFHHPACFAAELPAPGRS